VHNDHFPRNIPKIETFHRGKVLHEERRSIPASLYKKTLVLLKKSGKTAFVPVRSMQYLGIIDKEEIIFVNALNKRVIEFSWNNFRHKESMSLHQPVEYVLRFYRPGVEQEAKRMQGEFEQHMDLALSRLANPNPEIVNFK